MERLNKVIAKAGVCSRRKADNLILQGSVKVNGVIVNTLGYMVKKNDEILVFDKPIVKEEYVYYILNKPKNTVSTTSDEKGRKTVIDIAKEQGVSERVFPVGRLDYDSAGLLILTNDGEFANKVLHPRYKVEKEYLVRVDGFLKDIQIKDLNKKRFVLFEGVKYFFKNIKKVEATKNPDTTLLKIIIVEGKNHEVKNIFKSLGLNVTSLTRIRIGQIPIEGIGRGYLRKLKIKEIKDLKNIKKML